MYPWYSHIFLNVPKFGNETLFISDICSMWSFSLMINHTGDFYILLICLKNYLCPYWFPLLIFHSTFYIYLLFFFFLLLLRDSFCFSAELCMHAKSLPSCTTLCIYMDCSLPGSSVHGILQARILEWVAISFSRGSSQPRDRTHISYVGKHILYHWVIREGPVGKIVE